MRSIKADVMGTILAKSVNKKLGRKLPTNSFSPEAVSQKQKWGDKYYKINDILYGDQYPNSYLDLYLPNHETNEKCPIVVYLHGGGFLFCGKAFGDAIAQTNHDNHESYGGVNGFFKRCLDMGIAVASLEYAMAPKYRFPIAILQLNQALHFLCKQADEYKLDANKIIFMGSSAGADVVEIYCTALGNKEYAAKLGLNNISIDRNQIACAVVDESALMDYVPKDKNMLLLDQVWVGDKELDVSENFKLTYAPAYIKDFYPPCFINSSNEEDKFYDSNHDLYLRLKKINAQVEFYYPKKELGVYKHGYMMDFAVDQIAAECYEHAMGFIYTSLLQHNSVVETE